MKPMDGERESFALRIFVEYTPGFRARLENTIDHLVGLLDQLDCDPDLEDDELGEDDDPAEADGTDEPSLGSLDMKVDQVEAWCSYDFGLLDAEEEFDGREPDVDDEPSLGAPEMPFSTAFGFIDTNGRPLPVPGTGSASANQTFWARGGHEDLEQDDNNGIGDADGLLEQFATFLPLNDGPRVLL